MKRISILVVIAVCAFAPLVCFPGCAKQTTTDVPMPSLSAQDGWTQTCADDFSKFDSIEDVYASTAWRPVEHGPRLAGYWCDETVEYDAGEKAVAVRSYIAESHGCDVCPTSGIFCGGIETRHNFEQAFGYFEATVKVPVGYGMWSAFWLQCDGTRQVGNKGEDGTEIDVYESSYTQKPYQNWQCLAL